MVERVPVTAERLVMRVDHPHAGLGLPVARGIIKEHGGSIRVRSASNSGTTFSVSLPLQRKQAINDGSSS